MKIPLISNLVILRKQRKLRTILRGYRFLKNTNQIDKITRIKDVLTNAKLEIREKKSSKLIFGAGIKNAELITRQFILVSLGGVNLNKALLYAEGNNNSKITYPLPPEWRRILHENGYKVAKIRTALLWNSYIFINTGYSLITFIKQLIFNLNAKIKQQYKSLGKYIYFDSLSHGNLPEYCKTGQSHDILTWYQQWPGSTKDANTYCHNVKGSPSGVVSDLSVEYIPSPIPPLFRMSSQVKFFGWYILALTFSMLDIVRGNWWHALLMNQSTKATAVRLNEPNRLANNYLFHNSSWIYRPLWTYEAQQHGSQVTFYYYSTNCEGFKRKSNYPPLVYGCQIMNWPHYLVWDEYQADFVRRSVGENAKVSIVGPIWFKGCADGMPRIQSDTIAIFDVTPHRISWYNLLGLDLEYYVPSVCNQFITDILKVAKQKSYKCLWKRKRKIGSSVHPAYRQLSNRLLDCPDIVRIDPDISAYSVIDACEIVISAPFTSTALLARERGKPSCYYDPSGLIQENDRAAHGIPIIRTCTALESWINDIASSDQSII